MSIELILLAVNINLVAFSTHLGDIVGQIYRAVRAHRRRRGSRDRACHSGRLLPQPRLDRGRRHQSDEGLRRDVSGDRLSAACSARILAGLIALAGARARFPGKGPAPAWMTTTMQPHHARRSAWRRGHSRTRITLSEHDAMSRRPPARAPPN